MPPKSLTTSAAFQKAAIEADLGRPTLTESINVGGESAPGAQGANTRRKKYKEKMRRPRKDKNSTADNLIPNVTNNIPEVGSTILAGPEFNNMYAPSSLSETDTVATETLPQFQYERILPQPHTAPLVEIPVVAHYKFCDAPSTVYNDDDDNEQGLFATQKIKQGTRIISERPLFTLAAPGDQLVELMAAYENLPKSAQDRIWNLRPAVPEASDLLHNLRVLVDRLAFDLQNIILKSEAARTREERTTLDEMTPKLENAMNVWRVAARWHANRCSMTDLPEEQRTNLPKGTPITGLFLERAQIRHSCIPNCFASYDANLGRMNVHVTRDIAVGEELTLSAFADNMYYKNAEDRNQELSAWGLTCNCEACNKEHSKFEIHESARQRAHARVVLLVDFLTRLESTEVPEDELTVAQNIVMALIRDLKATGCESIEIVRWRNVLVDRILPARAMVVSDNEKLLTWQITLGHAEECEKVGRICYGEDREEFRMLRQTREATQACVDSAVAYHEKDAPKYILSRKRKGAKN